MVVHIKLFHLFNGVHNGSMVFATKFASYFRQAMRGDFFRELHRHLTRACDIACTPGGMHIRYADIAMVGNSLLDSIYGYGTFGRFEQVLQYATCIVH